MRELIGLDFDGVVGDIEHALQIGLQQMCDRTFEKGSIKQYGLEKDLNLTKDEVECLIDNYISTSEITLVMPLLPDVKDFLLELLEHQPVIIVTARPDLVPVRHFLSKYFCLPHKDELILHFARSGTKGKYLKELGVTTFVDDYWKNLIEVAHYGIRPVLVDQTWNQTLPSGHRRLVEMTWRIKSLNELRPLLNT
jgi:uncharacterized HAD superfamily protein